MPIDSIVITDPSIHKMALTKVKYWREAATVIMAAKTSTAAAKSHSNFNLLSKGYNDYKLLMLKRSSKSKFMPNAYVFPGGAIGSSDFSPEWLDMFRGAGCGDVNSQFQYSGPRPQMITRKHDSPLSNEVAFRICAIREVFEECGVLLATNSAKRTTDSRNEESVSNINNNNNNNNKEEQNSALSSSSLDTANILDKLAEWRDRVNEDDSQFLNMCKQMEIIPNIWSLREWSNWLTPTDLPKFGHSGRRFDTLFYMVCLEEMPSFIVDNEEVISAEWLQPLEVIHQYYNKGLWIAPPQLYELSRLCHFPFLNELRSFARHREKLGCECWLPVRFDCTDGKISILPGDDQYPPYPDYEGKLEPPKVDMTMQESLKLAKSKNRLEISDPFNVNVYATDPQPQGQVVPLGPEFVRPENSQEYNKRLMEIYTELK